MLTAFRRSPFAVLCAGLCVAALAMAFIAFLSLSNREEDGLGRIMLGLMVLIALAGGTGIAAAIRAQMRDMFLHLFASSPNPIYITDRSGAIHDRNERAQVLFEENANLFDDIDQLLAYLDDDDWPRRRDSYWQALQQDGQIRFDFATTLNGITRRFDLSAKQTGATVAWHFLPKVKEVAIEPEASVAGSNAVPAMEPTVGAEANAVSTPPASRSTGQTQPACGLTGPNLDIEALPPGLMVLRPDYTIEAINLLPTRLGMTEEDCLDEHVGGFIAPADWYVLADALAAAFERRGGGQIDVDFLMADRGTPIRIILPDAKAASEETDRAPNPRPRLVMLLLDRSEVRDLETQFAQSQRMQAVGQLAGGVAHDFNNLLTAMIGHCDLLLQRARPGDPIFPDVMQVKQNANRAANLVRQLLAFSRQQTLRPKILSPTDILVDVAHLVRRLIGEQILLKIEHGRDLGLVRVDQGQFEQVIINLAVNARDAMPSGGTLTITTSNFSQEREERYQDELMSPGNYVLIEIGDTGTGMEETVLEHIFEPFFSTKDQAPGIGGSGSGLGLATVHGIIRQTGGFIFPDSMLGAGTTFRIYLPRVESSGTADAVDEVLQATESAPVEPRNTDLTGKGVILLVEDETAVRMFASRALRNQGYTVFEAENGEHAMEELEAIDQPLDLMISDVIMPHVDGPTLAAHVRTIMPDVKILMISGYAEESARQNMDADLEIDFLSKPFSLQELAAKVKKILAD